MSQQTPNQPKSNILKNVEQTVSFAGDKFQSIESHPPPKNERLESEAITAAAPTKLTDNHVRSSGRQTWTTWSETSVWGNDGRVMAKKGTVFLHRETMFPKKRAKPGSASFFFWVGKKWLSVITVSNFMRFFGRWWDIRLSILKWIKHLILCF